ncbi:MAG: helix-turn-helix domain-containing protein [Opitutaceae bacterium]|nr:helix-turn-helix domain-containing protein [Opitutaceae bacterium]
MAPVRFRLKDFVRPGEAYHFARTDLAAAQGARYHDHDYHEIFWVLRGEGVHRCNGATQPLRPGGLHLIRPADRHSVSGTDHAPLRIINLAFPSASWTRIRARYFDRESDWFEQPMAGRVWPVDARALALLNHWSERLADMSRPRVALDGFLMDLPQLRATSPRLAVTSAPDWLLRAQRHLAQPEVLVGGTPALARLAGRSPSHFARATRRWLGRTPTDLLNEARMDHSARQLAETARPILEIMFDCGLNNISHFYTLFRQRHGMSPRRYRLQAHPTVRG